MNNDAGVAALTLVGGWLGTVGSPSSGAGTFTLVDQGLEFHAQTCNGNYCLNGGLVP